MTESEKTGLHSCLYEGQVRHRRNSPVAHAFTYRIFQVFLDLDELDTVFRRRLFWSTKGPSVAWFRRSDHLGPPEQPLPQTVREFVQQETGIVSTGPVRLLTHLRYFGYVMNPVSFFYCYDETGESIDAVVAEINNTPWGERFCYVIPWDKSRKSVSHDCDKEFHVSPFMPMEMRIKWRFSTPGKLLTVQVEDYLPNSERVFDATLALKRRELNTFNLARVLLQYPLITAKVWSAIYWQAARLKAKGVRFHPHPDKAGPQTDLASEEDSTYSAHPSDGAQDANQIEDNKTGQS